MYDCYIVDDEPLAIDVIKRHLQSFPELQVVGYSTDPGLAFEQIKELKPDLVFMDVKMPGISGLHLVSALPRTSAFIITTAYRDYAVDGFDLNVMDFLLKPISFLRFTQAVQKFLDRQDLDRSSDEPPAILIRANRANIRLPLREILYIEGLKDYVRIRTLSKLILSKSTLGQFHERLPQDEFIRVHRSFVVQKRKVERFTNRELGIGEYHIPVGKTYRKEVMTAIG